MLKWAMLSLLLFAASVRAQTPVTAPPTSLIADSAQCHWTFNGDIEHTHNDNTLTGGRYPDVAGPFQVNFTQTLFHTKAFIGAYFVGNQKTSDAEDTLFFNATMSAVPPPQQGDGMSVQTWSGHFTITPGYQLADMQGNVHNVPLPHGWGKENSVVYTYFPDGSTTTTTLFEPYHSIVDVTQPEVTSTQDKLISAQCTVDSPKSGNNYGLQTVSIESILPSTPITSVYTLEFSTYNYANNFATEEVETSDVILDPDFHHGIPGITLYSARGVGDIVHVFVPLDPAMLGAGFHKIVVRRTQPNLGDTLSTLMVFGLEVDTSVGPPPPPPPPPTPTPIWKTVGTVNAHDVQEFVDQTTSTPLMPLQFRICQAGDTNCSATETDH